MGYTLTFKSLQIFMNQNRMPIIHISCKKKNKCLLKNECYDSGKYFVTQQFLAVDT